MTITAPPVADPAAPPAAPVTDETAEPVSADAGVAALSPLRTSIASSLAAAGAGCAGAAVFPGVFPKVVAVLGALLGGGLVALSFRTNRPALVQALILPVAGLAGALLVSRDAGAGSASLPSLIREAITSGGLSQPPVPFDPGWRFLLVVMTALLAAGSAMVALSFRRAQLSVVTCVPLMVGGMLLAPAEQQTTTAVVVLALGFAGMSTAFGAQLTREGVGGANFEVRRLLRGAVVTVCLGVAVAVLSQLAFLFPPAKDSSIIPPKRPETPPAVADTVLFTVAADVQVPWRLGVLDVYGKKESAWLTPPYDPARFVSVPASGVVPEGGEDGVKLTAGQQTITATFVIKDQAGRVIPTPANPAQLRGTEAEFDPRTQSFRSPGRVRSGTTYTVTGAATPSAAMLNATLPVTKTGPFGQYLDAPEPGPRAAKLLASAPPLKDGPFDRLQFVRNAFFAKTVAAGSGKPVDVPAARVEELLSGKEATPYEITAAEALLARWAGIPARIGYGYDTGEQSVTQSSGPREVRPRDGSTWLEAYFEGRGWSPIVGKPPKAKASTATGDKKRDRTIKASDELALITYVPLQVSGVTLAYVVVKYYVLRLLPLLLVLVLIGITYPIAFKGMRTLRRRRYAHRIGPRAQIVVSYSELRDRANDLGIGDPTWTPLHFLDALAPDKEARELAWLVSRAVWGDLSRDLEQGDADAAVDMARSVQRRIMRAQPLIPSILGRVSRASLRDPYCEEIPNFWPQWRVRRKLRQLVSPVRLLGQGLRRRAVLLRRRPLQPASSVFLLIALLLGGCATPLDLAATPPIGSAASPQVPASLAGFVFRREPSAEKPFVSHLDTSLVTSGRVYSVRQGQVVQGSLQIAWFKKGVAPRRDNAVRQMLATFDGGGFTLARIGAHRVFSKRSSDSSLFVYLPPDHRYYELVVAREGFDAESVIDALLTFQGARSSGPVQAPVVHLPDASQKWPN